MAATQRTPLSMALLTWRQSGEFYFLRRFLDEMRNSTLNDDKSSAAKQLSVPHVRLEQFFALLKFAASILKALILPRGRIIVFNHSTRCRTEVSSKRPLYITEYFPRDGVIIVEDHPSDPCQRLGYMTLPGWSINRGADLIAWLYAKILYLRYRVYDRDIVNFYVRRFLWRLIFWALRPKAVFTFVWYGKEAIVAAAKSLHIKVCDIQHGIIYLSHPHYQLNDAPRGSESLCPDACLVYGEYWKNKLLASAWKADQLEVTGYFLDTAPAQPALISEPYILYTSQPHTHAAITGHIQTISAEAAIRGWRIIIALHPSDSPSAYQEIQSIPVVSIGQVDSYDLLRGCLLHISVSSTLLWESLVFRKSSYVLEFGREAQDLLRDFIDFGFGRVLAPKTFPEPFQMPDHPSIEYFFRDKVVLPFIPAGVNW